MNVTEKLIGKIEIQKDLVLLLIVGGLYFLSIALSNTFVNVFLWKKSGQFTDIAIYNLGIVVLQMLTFIIAGKWAKRVDRVIVLRLGVSFLALFYVIVLLFGGDAEHYLFFLGALLGVGFGFYWLAFNVLTFEITEPETRDFFNGFLGLLSSLAGMIGPPFAGWVITSIDHQYTGYRLIFGISLLLFFLAVITSFFLKRRQAKGLFAFKEIFNERRRNRNWCSILYAHLFQGLREGTFAFVIVVWVFMTTKSELALGVYGLVQSVVSFFAYYFVTRLVQERFRKKAILIGGLVLYAALALILFRLNFPLLITYGIVISIAYPLLLVPFSSLTYDVIGQSHKAKEMRIEYIVVREMFYNIGRIVSIVLFLFYLRLTGKPEMVAWLLGVLGTGHLLIYFAVRPVRLHMVSRRSSAKEVTRRSAPDGEGESPV